MGQKVVIQHTGEQGRHVDLRVEIARRRLRQGTIAAAVGISEGHLSHILAGRKGLSDELAARIAKAITEATA